MKLVFSFLAALSVSARGLSAAETPFAWAELIAFDNTAADYGVAEYLLRLGERPQAVSLLLCDADILHAHVDLAKDFPIGDQHASYFARPGNEDRLRQEWTAWQLRGLVAELARQGVKSYPSFFELSLERLAWTVEEYGEKPKSSLWVDAHPELFCRTRDGKPTRSLNVTKSLSDGTSYANFFSRQSLRFLKDYGFAGIHLADGYGHPRYALCDADFSEEVLERFASENPSARMPAEGRADWILKNMRLAWSRFNAQRHAAFVETVVKTLKPEGLSVWLNNCWTRDPHEAFWRYGVDYHRLAACGIDGFFVEASATVLALEGWSRDPESLVDDRRATLLCLASTVSIPLVRLVCIKDGLEQYNALRHAPTRLQGELAGLAAVWRHERLAAPSVMWCLTDGLTADEGRRLKRWSHVLPENCRPEGATVVVSAAAGSEELVMTETDHLPSSQALLTRLLKAGAVVSSSVDVQSALASQKPLLVLNPGRFPAAEREALRRRAGPFVEFGFGDGTTAFGALSGGGNGETGSWLEPLTVREPAADAVAACVHQLNEFSPVRPGRGMSDLRLAACRDAADRLIVVARNVRTTYLEAGIRVLGPVVSATALTEDPSLPVRVEPLDDGFVRLRAKIPPSGVVCIRCENKSIPNKQRRNE